MILFSRGGAFGFLRLGVWVGVHPQFDRVIPVAVHVRKQLVVFVQFRHLNHLLHHLLRIRGRPAALAVGGSLRGGSRGDVAGVRANEEVAITVANRIVINA